MAFVIVLSVTLVASIVTLVNSIDQTVLTMYGYQRYFSVLTPRNSLVLPPDIVEAVKKVPGTGEVVAARPAFTAVKTVFGKMPFVVFGMTPRDTDRILGRCNIKLLKGRMPIDGAAEVAMSEEIARNQRIKIGDVVLKPDSEDSFAAIPAKLVGTFKGPVWLAVTTRRFIEENFPVAPEGVIITSPDHPSRSEMAEEQSVLDKRIGDVIDKGRGRQWTYATLVRETHDSLSSLYLILNVVIGIVVFAIAFLVGMLSNIYFTQRLPEFATLAAIGHSRRSMMARAISETAVLCGVGWLLGAFCTYLLLRVLQIVLMEPRGLLLNPVDFTAYFYTLPLPLAIAGFAVFAIGIKLKRLDPITVIERRA